MLEDDVVYTFAFSPHDFDMFGEAAFECKKELFWLLQSRFELEPQKTRYLTVHFRIFLNLD